jgi:inhibitor of cysteine peptidase
MKEIIVTEAQNGGLISATTGDVLIVRLPENPTTGYRWEFHTTDNIAQTGDDFVVAFDATGAGGMRCLRFVMQVPGLAIIEAVLHRAWEADDITPQNYFSLSVEVL